MDRPRLSRSDSVLMGRAAHPSRRVDTRPETTASFHDRFVTLFTSHFQKLHRILNRLSGESELAADLTQEAFVRLYRRGRFPDAPEAWLITVAMNLFRNERSTRRRRMRLLEAVPTEPEASDPPASVEAVASERDERRRVRHALDRLAERDRRLLVLRAEGYRYREIAAALGLNEASVGVMLARARRAFLEVYEAPHAS